MEANLLPPVGSRERPHQLRHDWTHHAALEAHAYVRERPTPTVFDVHAGLEVGIVLGGEEVRTFPDGSDLRVRPGEVWLHPMWEAHGVRFAPGTQVVVLMFLPELLGDQLLGDLPWLTLFSVPPGQRPWVTSERVRTRVREIGGRLWEEVREEPVGWRTAVQLGLVQLLLELRRGWIGPEEASGSAPDLSQVLPAISALHAESGQWVTLDEAAALARLSRSYFSRLFRRCTGLSYHQFLLRTRLAQAAQRLRSSQVSVEGTAVEFGFVDGSHLHRHFVKLYGCTPAEYRRRGREQAATEE